MSASWRFHDGSLAEYTFAAAGASRSAVLERDGVGRVVAATVDGDRRSYAYGPAGQLVAADSLAGAFSFAYDACGRLERETSPAGTIVYEHDAAAQLTRRRDADGRTTQYAYDEAGRRVREDSSDVSRTWEWDEQGRLCAIHSKPAGDDEQITNVVVDALGELAEVDGSPLLWDSADPLAPLAWLDDQAVIGAGAPWATAGGDGAATWLAPDWQGTIGAPRDPWGAPQGAADPGPAHRPRLGYRGELELAGDVWLRARVYEPASRSFLSPDPLPAVAGTAWAANPYNYAGFIPVLGAAADVLNAGVYALEGDYANAAMSLVASVPGVGDAAALGKAAVVIALPLAKVAKYGDEAADVAKARRAAAPVRHTPETFGQPVPLSKVTDEWDDFLGPGMRSDIHPRRGTPDPDRIVSEDGTRSIRYGAHEMNSKPSKHHYHEETWRYDPGPNEWTYDNVLRRIR